MRWRPAASTLVLVGNFGDAPFHPDDVPKHVVATMTRATLEVAEAVDCPVGVNVLRNDADVAILADHDVRHSAPLAARGFAAGAMADGVERGLADATVITGTDTGQCVDTADLEAALDARDRFDLDTPILVGSAVTADAVGEVLSLADGVIVGTALKEDGDVRKPVSEQRVRELVAATRR